MDYVKLGDLVIDESYQRSVNDSHVLSIAADFDWQKFGVITASRRDGRCFIVDGQQRTTALGLQNESTDGTLVPAVVYTSLAREDEAKLYHTLNAESKRTTVFQAYQARLVYDPLVQEIDKVARQNGFIFDVRHEPHYLTTITGTLDVVTTHGVDTFDQTLAMLAEAFQFTEKITAPLLKAVGYLIGMHHDALDQRRLVVILQRKRPVSWDAQGADYARLNRRSAWVGNAAVLTNEYNKRLRDKRRALPTFVVAYDAWQSESHRRRIQSGLRRRNEAGVLKSENVVRRI